MWLQFPHSHVNAITLHRSKERHDPPSEKEAAMDDLDKTSWWVIAVLGTTGLLGVANVVIATLSVTSW